MHHHLLFALYGERDSAAAAAQDMATGGIPEGDIHAPDETDAAAVWHWLERNKVTGEQLARLRRGAGGGTPLVVRAADADVTRVLDILRRHGPRAVEDLGSDYGGTEAGLHPPSAAT